MFEFLFKYPPAVFSKGTFVLLASWPRWILFLLMAASALFFAGLLWWHGEELTLSMRGVRVVVVWALRTALACLLLLLLWHPAVSVAALEPQQNIIAVVVDDSRSMAIRDGLRSRLEDALKVLNAGLLKKLGERFQIRLYKLGTGLSRVANPNELTPAEPATHLGRALRQLSDESATLPIGAVVLLTDGADNSGGVDLATVSELRRRRLPVNAIGFGQDHLVKDVEVDGLDVPAKTLINARLEARVTIRQNGFSGERTRLVVLGGGAVLASREIKFNGNGQQTETIEFSAGPAGVKNLEVRLDPLNGEQNSANNAATRVLSVDDAKRRILYIEGEPRWEYKFLRRAVEDDPALQVISLLRTTQNKIYRQGIQDAQELAEGFPTKAEDLFRYDGLVIGSVEIGFFSATQQEMIRQFADRRGGGVLFLGGRASLSDGGYGNVPLAEILPVVLPPRKNTFQRDMAEPALTEAGKQSLICRIDDNADASTQHWKILPYLANYQDPGTAKPGATVLAQMKAGGKTMPLLITENYGRGRTAVFATGGSWRWQMQQPVEDMSHELFWRQLLRWLAGSSPSHVVASEAAPVLTDDGHVQLRAEVRDQTYQPAGSADVEATIVAPDGTSETVPMRPEPLSLGTYSADWNASKPGSYAAEVKAKTGQEDLGHDVSVFRREDGTAENFHREQNRDLLERLAEETGGHYYRPDEADRLAREVSYSEAGFTSRELKDLWDMPAVFFAALSLCAGEWLLRRRWGAV